MFNNQVVRQCNSVEEIQPAIQSLNLNSSAIAPANIDVFMYVETFSTKPKQFADTCDEDPNKNENCQNPTGMGFC